MCQTTLCDAIAAEDTSDTRWTCAMEAVVRVLNVVFWIVAALLVAALFLLNTPAVIAVLMVAVVVCSGAIAWYEFRLNPMADTERGEWTGRQLFYGLVFTITFFVGFLYVLTVVF
jgi:small-conductance mechanosensitive channel